MWRSYCWTQIIVVGKLVLSFQSVFDVIAETVVNGAKKSM